MSQSAPPEILQVNGVTVVRPGSEYSNLYEGLLENFNLVKQLAEAIQPPRMILDLRNVKFVGSAFLGFAVSLSKTLRSRDGGRFAICCPNTFIRTALSLSKLETLIEVYDDVESAAAAIGPVSSN